MAENVIEEAEGELDTSPAGETWPSASLFVHEPHPPDLSRLSEQQVIDLFRRIDSTRGRQQEIMKALQGAEEHLEVAYRMLIGPDKIALDPGHQMKLRECADLALALLRKVQEAYEPTRIRKPWESYE